MLTFIVNIAIFGLIAKILKEYIFISPQLPFSLHCFENDLFKFLVSHPQTFNIQVHSNNI